MCFYRRPLLPIQTQEPLWYYPLVHQPFSLTMFPHRTALSRTKFKHIWECSKQGTMTGITDWVWKRLKLSAKHSERTERKAGPHSKFPKVILRVVKHHNIRFSVIYITADMRSFFECQLHCVCVFAVGVVFFLDTVDGETQCVAVEAKSCTIRFSDMKGYVGGIVVRRHGHLRLQH